MTTLPDRPRDDRRMHEGREPGDTESRGDTTTLDHEDQSDGEKPKKESTYKK